MVKHFHQALAEITTWWWVMKNQAWYAAELMSWWIAGVQADQPSGLRGSEWRAGLPDTWGIHLRHSVTLTQKQAGQAAVHKSSAMEAVKRTAHDPKQHLFFSKMLEVFSLLPVKMKLHLLMISLLTEVAGWRQRFTGASCLPNAAGDTGGQRMV